MAEDRQDEKNYRAKMEAMLQTYERKNQELEERELEVRYRFQMLENTMPALMMWNMWRMMMSVQNTGGPHVAVQGKGQHPKDGFSGDFDPNAPVHSNQEELSVKLRSLENKSNNQNRTSEESTYKNDLKGKLKDLEKILAKEQVLSDVIDKEVAQDVELFEKFGKLAKQRAEMVKRIKDLELKEKLYKETIEHADNFTAQLENKFDMKDKYLMNEESCSYDEGKNRPDVDSISSEHLEEKVLAIDNELIRLRDELNMIDKEKVELEDAERKVLHELQEAMNELENMRGELEEPLKAKIEQSRQRSQAIEEELKASENYKLKMDPRHVNTNEVGRGNTASKVPSKNFKIPSSSIPTIAKHTASKPQPQTSSSSIPRTPSDGKFKASKVQPQTSSSSIPTAKSKTSKPQTQPQPPSSSIPTTPSVAKSKASETHPQTQPQPSPPTVLPPGTNETSFIECIQPSSAVLLFVYLFMAALALKNAAV